MRPGDVLAWRKDNIVRGVSTGHTCVIAGYPNLEDDGRVRVRVIDSTRKRHANDTRPAGTNGVGAGDMWFVIDDAGKPIGFYVDDSHIRAKSTQVAIGRLSTPTSKPVSTGNGTTDSAFLGLTESAAVALAEQHNLQWRTIIKDSAVQPVSMKLRDDRVNFVIENGKVIRVRRG